MLRKGPLSRLPDQGRERYVSFPETMRPGIDTPKITARFEAYWRAAVGGPAPGYLRALSVDIGSYSGWMDGNAGSISPVPMPYRSPPAAAFT